jgi:hypothetical protein
VPTPMTTPDRLPAGGTGIFDDQTTGLLDWEGEEAGDWDSPEPADWDLAGLADWDPEDPGEPEELLELAMPEPGGLGPGGLGAGGLGAGGLGGGAPWPWVCRGREPEGAEC